MTEQFTDAVIEGLAWLRKNVGREDVPPEVEEAFNSLDNAGVFAALDEQTDYRSAEDILAESAAVSAIRRNQSVDPGEALQVLHNTWQRDGRHGRPDPLALPDRTGPDPSEWGDTTAADMARHQLTGNMPVAGRRLTQEQAEAMFEQPGKG